MGAGTDTTRASLAGPRRRSKGEAANGKGGGTSLLREGEVASNST